MAEILLGDWLQPPIFHCSVISGASCMTSQPSEGIASASVTYMKMGAAVLGEMVTCKSNEWGHTIISLFMHGISGDLLWNFSFRNTSFFFFWWAKNCSASLASRSNLARLGVWCSQSRRKHPHRVSFVLKQAMGPYFYPKQPQILKQYLMHWAEAPYAALFWAKSMAFLKACFAFSPAFQAGSVSACFLPQN